MFGLFRKKTKKEQLQRAYKRLMEEAFRLSTTNRTLSDLKYAEADAVMKELEALQQHKYS